MRLYTLYREEDDGRLHDGIEVEAESDAEFNGMLPWLLAKPDQKYAVLGEGGDGGFSEAHYGPRGVRTNV